MLFKFLILFLCIFSYTFLKNCYRVYRVNKIYSYFSTILTHNPNNLAYETKDEILKLFKEAGVKDSFIPITQPMGYGQLARFNASTFKAYPSPLNVFVGAELEMFDYALGVYKNRVKKCFSPFYWIDMVIFLPRTIFQYLGLKSDSIFIKLSNLIYWLFGIFFGLFQSEFKAFILSYLPKNFFNFQ